MIKFALFFLVLYFGFAPTIFAQNNIYRRIISMHLDFQKYADTTFIIQKLNNGYPKPDYYILSKKGAQINIYFYGDATRIFRIPAGIKSTMKKANFNEDKMRSFENVLFYPLVIANDDAVMLWRKVLLTKPWQINDDPKNQYCADASIKLFDGTDITLFLITKNNIKSLLFPSPDFFEEKCPGNEHRKAFLNIQNTFKSYFKF